MDNLDGYKIIEEAGKSLGSTCKNIANYRTR